MQFVDPSGLVGEVPAFDPVTFVLANIAAFFLSKLFFGHRKHAAAPKLPPAPIQATAFSPLAAPSLPTSFSGNLPPQGSFPSLTAAGIAQVDIPIEPIGLLEDPFFNAALFFSGPMLRALSWAGRTGQGFLLGLGERGAVQIASAASKTGTKQIVLKAGTELARTFGTEAGQTTAEGGGFFITQSALRRIGLKMGVSSEALQEALNLSGRNPATRLGLFRVVRDIPAKIRPIAGGLVNEIVVRKPFRRFLEFFGQTVVRLK